MDLENFKSLFCCLIPGFKRSKNDNERKTITEKRREKIRRITGLQVSRSYQLKRDRILGRITFDFSRIVVVWGYGNDLPREVVLSQLNSCGKITLLQDRWTVTETGSKIWRGALVEYSRIIDAERAAFSLPSHVKYIRSTMLETVINTLADCELLHPEYKNSTSKVVINRKVPLRVEEVDDLHRMFHTFGPVNTFFINNRPTTIGAICEVSYAYLTQAYLAMIMTNGVMFSRGVLSSVIGKTEKDREILQDAKDCIVLLSQCCFPS